MIPAFPKFKKLELSDKEEIENFTKNFPPYSDFNFVSMWAWDIKGEMLISKLNDNLVVRFTDYLTGEPFYSFLGLNMVNETANELLEKSKVENIKCLIKLIPENMVQGFDEKVFKITEDIDHHDYIIPLEIFSKYDTNKTKDRKKSVIKFENEFGPTHKQIDLNESNVKKSVFRLFDKWSKEKAGNDDIINELSALKRYVDTKHGNKHLSIGVFVGDELVGFCFSEVHDDDYCTIHFCKAEKSLSSGLYSYILQQNALSLIDIGKKQINLEQDLGIPNMRAWKQSHGAHTFLKKYNIEYNI